MKPGCENCPSGFAGQPDTGLVGRRCSVHRLVATAAALLALGTRAQGTGYFGPEMPFQIQPEIDAYYEVGKDLRLVAQLQPTFIPAESNSTVNAGLYADWLIGAPVRLLLSPDRSKTRTVDVRVGLQYDATLNPGTQTSSRTLVLQEDFTPKYFLPWDILVLARNRFQERWSLEGSDQFTFRYLGRVQFEREFKVGHASLNPFVNAEFTWSAPPAMWTQFRLEAGLQYAPDWFGWKQILEVNFSIETKLQPSHSWSPVLGIIWYIFL